MSRVDPRPAQNQADVGTKETGSTRPKAPVK